MLLGLICLVRDSIVYLLKVLLKILDKQGSQGNHKSKPLLGRIEFKSNAAEPDGQSCTTFNLCKYTSPQISADAITLISDRIRTLNTERQRTFDKDIACLLVILYENNFLVLPFVNVITDLFTHLQIPLKKSNTKPARYSSLNRKGEHSKSYLSAQTFLLPLIPSINP